VGTEGGGAIEGGHECQTALVGERGFAGREGCVCGGGDATREGGEKEFGREKVQLDFRVPTLTPEQHFSAVAAQQRKSGNGGEETFVAMRDELIL